MVSLSDDEDIPQLVEAPTSSISTSHPPDETSRPGSTQKVPITIVTGYLGAGKTTLLNHILTEQHGKRIAVLLNEFGDSADIEKSLTVAQDGQQVEEWINLANGCICCSIKDQGVNALESLMERSGSFDYILLETTGLADPGNIAPMFWTDEGLGSSIYLDGVVTVVDAKNILTCLDEPVHEDLPADEEDAHAAHGELMSTAHLQISHADVIILNKTDLVSPAQLTAIEARLTSINALARLTHTQHARIRASELEGSLLDLNAYSTFSEPPPTKGHSHLDATISTITIPLPRCTAAGFAALEQRLRDLLWRQRGMRESGYEIHRTKGRIVMADGRVKIVQGVREIFDIEDAPSEGGEGSAQSKLVFIGRGLWKDNDTSGYKIQRHSWLEDMFSSLDDKPTETSQVP